MRWNDNLFYRLNLGYGPYILPKADYERRHGKFPRYFPGWYLFVPSRDLEEGELVSKKLNAGNYNYSWNARSLPSGVYIYKIQAGAFQQVRKMVYLK